MMVPQAPQEHLAPYGGGMIDPVQGGIARVQLLGVELDQMALAALGTLPPEHACEMLDYVAENTGSLRNASKYITGTVKRGFMPRTSAGAAVAATAPGGFACGWAPSAAALAPGASSDMLQLRAQELGLTLSNEAINALATMPQEHSDELMEFVAEKRQELRDPSNYIASTVARGFKSRRMGGGVGVASAPWASGGRQQGAQDIAHAMQRCQALAIDIDEMARLALSTLPPSHAVELLDHVFENHTNLRNVSSYISRTISRGFVSRNVSSPSSNGYISKGSSKGGGSSHANLATSLMPHDITALEGRVLNYNSNAAHTGRMLIDMPTYLALRCVPDWHAAELLDTLEAKVGQIQSPCNYIQAAVTKSQQAGKGGGGAHAGGQSGFQGSAWNPNGGGYGCAGGGFGSAVDGYAGANGYASAEAWGGATEAWTSGALSPAEAGEAGDSFKRQRLW